MLAKEHAMLMFVWLAQFLKTDRRLRYHYFIFSLHIIVPTSKAHKCECVIV